MWSGNHSLALVSIIQRFTLFYFEIEVRGFFVVITFPAWFHMLDSPVFVK